MKKTVLFYELIGIIFIILFGSFLHFSFELSGYNLIIALFSAVNESVWEHLKLGFWPALLFAIIEYKRLKKSTNNFFFAKTVGIYLIPILITVLFYSYTLITGGSVFVLDILIFIIAVIIGQLTSYKLLTYKKLPKNLEKISLIALIILLLMFVIFTFYPLEIEIFRDPISGGYGIVEHGHLG